jgi:hypothetical protein
MAYLAHCAPVRIPLILVEGALDDEAESSPALLALCEVSLVKNDPFDDRTPALTVHRLVQAVARARAKTNGTAPQAAVALLARLATAYPNDGYDNPTSWPLCAQLTSHFLMLREVKPDKVASWADLLMRAGSYFSGRADYTRAELLFREATLLDSANSAMAFLRSAS